MVATSEITVATGEAYFLASRDTRDASPEAIAFRAWILSEHARGTASGAIETEKWRARQRETADLRTSHGIQPRLRLGVL